jgi:hypothetical protein
MQRAVDWETWRRETAARLRAWTARLPGGSASEPLPILRRAVPRTFFGRELTETERRDLRRMGRPVPPGSIAVRAADAGELCIVYRPAGTGYTHADIYVVPKG